MTVRDCTIECSLTGHNVKSRAYINCLVNNIIRHAANRELDLVDADGNTTIPESDAFLVGNTIIKNPECQGNRTVIHFGEDAGTIRSGTVWLIDNVISTPFLSPVLEITSGRGAIFLENTFDNDDADREGTLALLHDPGMKICGRTNTFPPKFLIRKTFENEPSPVSFDEIPELPKFLEILVDRYRRERSKK